MRRAIVPLFGALLFALPKPVAATAPGGIVAMMCGQPGISILIPLDDDAPKRPQDQRPANPCCTAACHAGSDRQKRGDGKPAS